MVVGVNTKVDRALVLGIGNTLLRDDGAGVHTVCHLREHHRASPEVAYVDGGTLSFTLAAEIARADRLIVVDAAQLDAPPGTVHCMVDADMDGFLGRVKRGVHEVGLLDLLDMARLTGDLPAQRALIGIQPAAIDWGDHATAAVAAAIPQAAACVLELLAAWPAHGPNGVAGMAR